MCPPLLPPDHRTGEGGRLAGGGQGRRPGGSGVVGMRGERGREVWGSDPWPQLGQRRPGRDGRWQRAAGGAGPALQILSMAKEWGRSTRGLGGSISPAHLGLAWSREAGSREAGAAAEQACGGGAGAWEEARLVVVAVAELEGGAWGLFIAAGRWWGGQARRWRVGAARRAARRALMALGRARASWSGARAARWCRDDGT